MLKLSKLSFTDSDVDSVPSWLEMLFMHQDEDTSAIASFHVTLDMTRDEFETKTIKDLIDAAKPLIAAKLGRITI